MAAWVKLVIYGKEVGCWENMDRLKNCSVMFGNSALILKNTVLIDTNRCVFDVFLCCTYRFYTKAAVDAQRN